MDNDSATRLFKQQFKVFYYSCVVLNISAIIGFIVSMIALIWSSGYFWVKMGFTFAALIFISTLAYGLFKKQFLKQLHEN